MADDEPLESELCINSEENVKQITLKPRQKENILNDLKNDLNEWNKCLENNKLIDKNDKDNTTHYAIKILRYLYQFITKVDLKNVLVEEPARSSDRVCSAEHRKSRKDNQNTPTKQAGSPERRSKSVSRTPPRNKVLRPAHEKEPLNEEEKRNTNRKTTTALKHQIDLWEHKVYALLDDSEKTEIEQKDLTIISSDILMFLYTKEYMYHADLQNVFPKEPALSASTGKRKGLRNKQNNAPLTPNETPTNLSRSPERRSLSPQESERRYQQLYPLKKRLFEKDYDKYCDCDQNKKDATLEHIRQQQELKELESKINKLESDNQYHISEVVRLKKERETLDEKDKLRSRIKELEHDKERFRVGAARLDEEKNALELECGDSYNAAKYMRYKTKRDNYRTERDESRQEITLNAKLKIIKQKGESVHHLVVLHDQNEKLKEQVRVLLEDMGYLKERLKIANRDIKQITAERDVQKSTVEQQKTLIQEIKNSQTLESCMQAEQRYRVEIDRANYKVESLTSKVRELSDTLDAQHTAAEQSERTIEDLKDRLAHANNRRRTDVQQDIDNKRLFDIEKENISLKIELNMARQHLEESREQNKALEKRCEKETEERYNRDKLYTELKNENDKLQKGRNAALSELQKRTAEKNQLAEKLVTEIKEHEQLKKDKNDIISVFKEKSNRDKEKISKLEQEYKTLNARFKHEKEMRVANDETSNNKLMKENDRLRSERNLARIEVQKVTKEKDDVSHELREVVTTAKSEYDQLQREKDDLILEFKEKSDRYNEKIRNLQEEYDNFCARHTETGTRFHKDDAYNKICEENNILRSERIELLKLANEKDAKLHELKQEVTAVKSKCEMLKNDKDKIMTDFKDQSKKHNEKISNLRQECENLLAKYERETKAKSHEEIKNDRLRNEINLSKTELVQIKKEKEDILHKLEKEFTAAKVEQEKCTKLEKEIEILNLRYKKEKDTTSHKDDTYNNLREENNRLINERDLAIAKVMEITNEKEGMSHKLKQEVATAQSENDKLKMENDNLIKEFNEECNRDKQTISKLRQECEGLRSKGLELKGSVCPQCDEYERTMAKMKKEKQELQDNYNIVSTKANNAKKKIQELLDINKESNVKKQNLESILSKLEIDLENQKRIYESLQGEHYSLTMCIDNLQPEIDDLKMKCKSKEDLLHKADKENRRLKVDIDQLKSNIVGLHQEIESLNTRIEILTEEKLELESRTRSRSPQVISEPKQCQNCWKYKNDISELKKEVNNLRDRLSEAAGNKLRDNNPNIADLSDMNRPTSLAEKFSTLYTDEYTDAMEVIEKNMSEEECAGTMLQWLKSCYDWCERLALEQRDLLTQRSIGFMEDHLRKGESFVISARCLIHVKEFQKKIAVDSLIAVAKICHIKSLKEENFLNDSQISKYIKKCSEICWMMQITDPPLCLDFDVKRGDNLDRNSYNVFTKSGSKVDFLVWPVLNLHKTGPLLAKGVAQGM